MLITCSLLVAPETYLRQMSSDVGGDDELNEWWVDLFRLTECVSLLTSKLRELAECPSIVDVGQWMLCYTFDVSSAITV
jgi:hypothetical protein